METYFGLVFTDKDKVSKTFREIPIKMNGQKNEQQFCFDKSLKILVRIRSG